MASLKCALTTLCATFFLRSLLMSVLILEIIIPNKNVLQGETNIVDAICITLFLVFGEILPITTIYVYHYLSFKSQKEG